MRAIAISAIGLQRDLERLKLAAHNVANTSTAGFKRQIAVQQPFYEVIEGVEPMSQQLDTRMGMLMPTGQALDIALPEGRYLLVEADDGSQALTRQGALVIDAQGSLRTLGNLKVLGQGGAITMRTDGPAGAEIDAQGQLSEQGHVVDSLRLVSLKPGERLQATGNGLFIADSQQWDVEIPTARVRGGHLEQSNVLPSQEMVAVMAATRHAETMVRVFQAADEMQATAIRRLGENP